MYHLIYKYKKTALLLAIIASYGSIALMWPDQAAAVDWGGYIFGAVNQLLLLLINLLGLAAAVIMRLIVPLASYNDFINSSAVQVGWIVMRDLVNLLFVVALMFVAIGTILGIDRYQWRAQLPKLVVSIIIVNFSRTICGLIIDFFQIFMLTFINAIRSTLDGNFTDAFRLYDIVKLSQNGGESLTASDVTFSLAVAAVALLVACVVALVLVITLATRIVFLWILVTLSPIAFTGGILPKTDKWASMWWDKFINQLTNGVVLAFFLWLGLYVGAQAGNEIVNCRNADGTVQTGDCQQLQTASVGQAATTSDNKLAQQGSEFITKPEKTLGFIISAALLLGGVVVASQMGGVVGSIAGGFMGKLQSAGFGVAKIAGVAALGSTGLGLGAVGAGAFGLTFGTQRGRRLASLVSKRLPVGGTVNKLRKLPKAWDEAIDKEHAGLDKEAKTWAENKVRPIASASISSTYNKVSSKMHGDGGKLDDSLQKKDEMEKEIALKGIGRSAEAVANDARIRFEEISKLAQPLAGSFTDIQTKLNDLALVSTPAGGTAANAATSSITDLETAFVAALRNARAVVAAAPRGRAKKEAEANLSKLETQEEKFKKLKQSADVVEKKVDSFNAVSGYDYRYDRATNALVSTTGRNAKTELKDVADNVTAYDKAVKDGNAAEAARLEGILKGYLTGIEAQIPRVISNLVSNTYGSMTSTTTRATDDAITELETAYNELIAARKTNDEARIKRANDDLIIKQKAADTAVDSDPGLSEKDRAELHRMQQNMEAGLSSNVRLSAATSTQAKRFNDYQSLKQLESDIDVRQRRILKAKGSEDSAYEVDAAGIGEKKKKLQGASMNALVEFALESKENSDYTTLRAVLEKVAEGGGADTEDFIELIAKREGKSFTTTPDGLVDTVRHLMGKGNESYANRVVADLSDIHKKEKNPKFANMMKTTVVGDGFGAIRRSREDKAARDAQMTASMGPANLLKMKKKDVIDQNGLMHASVFQAFTRQLKKIATEIEKGKEVDANLIDELKKGAVRKQFDKAVDMGMLDSESLQVFRKALNEYAPARKPVAANEEFNLR